MRSRLATVARMFSVANAMAVDRLMRLAQRLVLRLDRQSCDLLLQLLDLGDLRHGVVRRCIEHAGLLVVSEQGKADDEITLSRAQLARRAGDAVGSRRTHHDFPSRGCARVALVPTRKDRCHRAARRVGERVGMVEIVRTQIDREAGPVGIGNGAPVVAGRRIEVREREATTPVIGAADDLKRIPADQAGGLRLPASGRRPGCDATRRPPAARGWRAPDR